MAEFEFDVFKGRPGKNPLWLGRVNGLPRATELMNKMAARLPDEYFVSSASSKEIVVSVNKPKMQAPGPQSGYQNPVGLAASED